MISALLWTVAPRAEAADLQAEDYVAFMFFNGINTEPQSAYETLAELRKEYGDTTVSGEKIRYEAMYNHTAGAEDLLEVYLQRVAEEGDPLASRLELYDEALYGGGDWWSALRLVLPAADRALGDFAFDMEDFVADEVSGWVLPRTLDDYVEQRARLDTHLLAGQQMLFYAHSQGNLFANAAYDYLQADGAVVPDDWVRVVHVAPASVLVHGPHVLANLDLVINALRPFGPVPSVTHNIPPPGFRPPGVNETRDPWGHNLLAIYMNDGLAPDGCVEYHVQDALNALSGSGVSDLEALNGCAPYFGDGAGQAPEPLPTYAVTFHLEANELFELLSAPGNTLPEEVTSGGSNYTIEDLGFGGYVGAVDAGMQTWSYVIAYDGDGFVAATANTDVTLDAGTAAYLRQEIEVADPLAAGLAVRPRPVLPEYSPSGEDVWVQAVGAAMLGAGPLHADKAPGSLDVGVGVLHDFVPNRSIIEFSLEGRGRLDL